MDSVVGRPTRLQCKATNGAGHRCRNWASNYQEVCRLHGGNTPQAKRKAHEAMLAARDMAAEVLIDAMHAEACDACGRSRDLVLAVRAAIAVLDRTGLGPHATLAVTPVSEPAPWVAWMRDEELAQMHEWVEDAKRRMEAGDRRSDDAVVTDMPPRESDDADLSEDF